MWTPYSGRSSFALKHDDTTSLKDLRRVTNSWRWAGITSERLSSFFKTLSKNFKIRRKHFSLTLFFKHSYWLTGFWIMKLKANYNKLLKNELWKLVSTAKLSLFSWYLPYDTHCLQGKTHDKPHIQCGEKRSNLLALAKVPQDNPKLYLLREANEVEVGA